MDTFDKKQTDLSPQNLAGDYAPIAEIIGVENTKRLHRYFQGQQITLPKRLYSRDYVVQQVNLQRGEKTLSQLAKEYDYTLRRLQQLLKEYEKGDLP